MARTTTVICSIHSGGKSAESVTVDTVGAEWAVGAGDNGGISLSATVPATVTVGDTITDSAGNSYLITAISGSDLTCQDFDSTATPATGAATIQEAYQSITAWEADLDDTVLYRSSDTAVGECHNTAAFNEAVLINGGGTVGLTKTILTAHTSERHDGTAGSGARNVYTGTSIIFDIEDGSVATRELCWLEIRRNATANSNMNHIECNDQGCDLHIHHNIVWDGAITSQSFRTLRGINATVQAANDSFVHNNLVYDIVHAAGGTAVGILSDEATYNNTVYGVTNVGGTAGDGFQENGTDVVATNNISVSCGGNDFNLSSATESYNLSSDATAAGTGSLTSKAATDQFVSTTGGSEDLHLKSGADAIDAGTDLGTTPSGVELDIDGRDRDAEADTWDIGADEFVSSAVTVNVSPVTSAIGVVAASTTFSLSQTPVTASMSIAAPSFTLAHSVSPVTASLTVVTPSVGGVISITPDPVTATLNAVALATQMSVSVSPVTSTATVPEPSLAMSLDQEPVTLTFAVVAPTTALAVNMSPVTATFTVVVATASLVTIVSPDPVTSSLAVASPSFAMSLSLSPIGATITVVAPTVRGLVQQTRDLVVVVDVGENWTCDIDMAKNWTCDTELY